MFNSGATNEEAPTNAEEYKMKYNSKEDYDKGKTNEFEN
jgi:hypothetical protein